MRGRYSKLVLGILISVGMILSSIPFVSQEVMADQTVSETGVKLGDYDGLVKIKEDFDQATVQNEYLTALKEVRAEVYNDNLPFNGKPIQEYLRDRGISSLEEYLNLVEWDKGCEMIAIQRAYETEVHGVFAHIRANGEEIWTARYNNLNANGENLAWGFGSARETVYGWYNIPIEGKSERESLVEANGNPNAENGHLHQLLNPDLRYHGLGMTSHGAAAGEYSTSLIEAGSSGWQGQHTVTVGVKSFSDNGASVSVKSTRTDETVYGEKPAPRYENTTDLFEGETRIVTQGSKEKKIYEVVGGTFTAANQTKRYMRGSLLEYTLDATRNLKESTPGTPDVIQRGIAKKVIETESILFATKRVKDPNMFATDDTVVETEGENGEKTVVYKTYQKDGQTVKEQLSEEVTKKPVDKVVKYGALAHREEIAKESIPFKTIEENNPNLPAGERKIKVQGKAGEKNVTYDVVYDTETNAVKSERVTSEVIVKEAIDQVEEVGQLTTTTEYGEAEKIPYATEERESNTLYVGERKVDQAGVDGSKRAEYTVKRVGDEEPRREFVKYVVDLEPVTEIVLVGTKKHDVALITSGSTVKEGSEVKKGTQIVLHIDGDPKALESVSLNDEILERDVDYTVEAGSTIIKLSEDKSKALALGNHTIVAKFGEDASYNAGTVSVSFKVAKKVDNNTNTGNGNNQNKGSNGNNGTSEGSNDGINVGSQSQGTDQKADSKVVNKGNKPATGDESGLYVLLAMALVSSGTVVVVRRKEKKTR